FPESLHVADESVNAFVARAMAECASGDYERFRLLWSIRHDPLPRDEYEQGWQAVQRIEVRRLEPVILSGSNAAVPPDSDQAYAILAEVSLDPNRPAGQREPNREAVLLIVREDDAWRLARPPRALKEWIHERAATRDENAGDDAP
ncbi:MAG: hypothetical protein ACE5F8_09425, partial [Woeseiaceae bacterium]